MKPSSLISYTEQREREGSFELIFQIIGWTSNLEFDLPAGILMKEEEEEDTRERAAADVSYTAGTLSRGERERDSFQKQFGVERRDCERERDKERGTGGGGERERKGIYCMCRTTTKGEL